MKTEPQPRQHHEGEPPPESLIHHAEPTALEAWLRRLIGKGAGFWMGVALILGGLIAAAVIAYRIGGPSRDGVEAWNELAAVSVAPSALTPFGPDPNAGLPDRLREIARAHPNTMAARWAELRAASLLLNEGSAELATSRRSAGVGKILEADELFNEIYDEADHDSLKSLAALGRARAAEARLGIDADETERAQLDEVIALYDEVIDEFPETPEAKQAASLIRRLRRSDSIAFYDQLSRFDPVASASPDPSGLGLPGLDLAPGASGSLDDLFGLPPGGGSGFPGSSIPGLDNINLSPPANLDTPAEPSDTTPAPDLGSEIMVLPDVDPPAEPPADAPQVPDDPFGGGTPEPAPVDPEPASVDPEPAPAEPAPGSELPNEVFPSGGPNR